MYFTAYNKCKGKILYDSKVLICIVAWLNIGCSKDDFISPLFCERFVNEEAIHIHTAIAGHTRVLRTYDACDGCPCRVSKSTEAKRYIACTIIMVCIHACLLLFFLRISCIIAGMFNNIISQLYLGK